MMGTNGRHQSDEIRAVRRVPAPVGSVLSRWHPSLASRLFGLLIAVPFAVIGVLLVTHPQDAADGIFGFVMLVVGPLGCWLMWGRPSLVLTDEQLVVQNALVGYVVPLSSVKRVTPDGWGLAIEVRGRARPVIAMAVVKANISFILRRRARADLVGATIAAAAQDLAPPAAK